MLIDKKKMLHVTLRRPVYFHCLHAVEEIEKISFILSIFSQESWTPPFVRRERLKYSQLLIQICIIYLLKHSWITTSQKETAWQHVQ